MEREKGTKRGNGPKNSRRQKHTLPTKEKVETIDWEWINAARKVLNQGLSEWSRGRRTLVQIGNAFDDTVCVLCNRMMKKSDFDDEDDSYAFERSGSVCKECGRLIRMTNKWVTILRDPDFCFHKTLEMDIPTQLKRRDLFVAASEKLSQFVCSLCLKWFEPCDNFGEDMCSWKEYTRSATCAKCQKMLFG